MREFTPQGAIDWIQGERYKGMKNGLENTRALLEALGHPEKTFRCVHIAGTNGKGSTAALTERALREAGVPPERVVGLLAWWSGLAPFGAEVRPADLVAGFDLRRVPHAPAVLDARVKGFLGIREASP